MSTPPERALDQMEAATAALQQARERVAELEAALREIIILERAYARGRYTDARNIARAALAKSNTD